MAASAITSIKKIIGYKGNSRILNTARNDSLDPVPTIGFRVGYKRNTNKLQVNVLGARHLPVSMGRTSISGYIVKVKLFPGHEKYETESKPESWPTYNQEFIFEITNVAVTKNKRLDEILNSGNFIVFTIYAEDITRKKKLQIGAATWKLDHTLFEHKLHTDEYGENEELQTPEIWKKTEEISSGITGVKQTREEKNNQFEISLRYTPGNPEEGEGDSLSVGVTKLRWSIQATRECEQKNGLSGMNTELAGYRQIASHPYSYAFESLILRRYETLDNGALDCGHVERQQRNLWSQGEPVALDPWPCQTQLLNFGNGGGLAALDISRWRQYELMGVDGMQICELLGRETPQLYVKIKVLEDERSIKELKTRKFAPNISVHFRPEKDNSVLTVPLPQNRDKLTCQLSLCTKPTLGQKTVFGRVLIGPSCKTDETSGQHWDRIYQTPRVTIPQWYCIR